MCLAESHVQQFAPHCWRPRVALSRWRVLVLLRDTLWQTFLPLGNRFLQRLFRRSMRALALLLALAALDRSDAGNSKDMSMTVAQSASSIDTGDPKVILTLTKTGGALVSTDRVFLASGSTCASFTYGLNVFKTTAGKAADTATDKHAGETDYTNAAVTKVASFSESLLVGGWDGTAKAFTFKLPALTQYWNRRWRVCYFDSTAQGGTEIGGGAGYNANDACDDTGAQVYLTSTFT